MQSEFVEHIFIYGDDARDYLVAFIYVSEWAQNKNFPKIDKSKEQNKPAEEAKEGEEPPAEQHAEEDDGLNNQKNKLLVYEDLLRIAEHQQLNSYEKPR